MSPLPNLTRCALLGALLAGTTHAQWDVNGPNAVLTVNGRTASVSDPLNHDVPVTLPGFFSAQIVTGVNAGAPLVLLGSFTQPGPGAGLPGLPWGGSLDIGTFAGSLPSGVFVIGNGLNPTSVTDAFFASNNGIPGSGLPPTFVMTYAAGTAVAGVSMAIQAIVVDPTNPLFPLDNTEAADCNFVLGFDAVIETDDDGTVEVPFGLGMTFDFHGQTYTSVFINANGIITFGSVENSFTFARDAVTWATDVPSISVAMADWSPQLSPSEGVRYFQVGTSVEISWDQCPHSFSSDTNDFSIVLELDDGMNPSSGSFGLRWWNLDPTATIDNGSGVLGHTPGGAAGMALDTDLNVVQTFGAGDAMIEEHDADGFAISFLGWDGVGSRRNYNDFTTNKNGRMIDFVPNGFITVPGDSGYVALPMGAQPNDVVNLAGSNGFMNVGGDFGYVSGAFEGLTPGSPLAGVFFDPMGLNAAAVVTHRFGDPGGPVGTSPPSGAAVRTHQMIEFLAPPLPGLVGQTTLRVVFDDGSFVDRSAYVTAPGTFVAVYQHPQFFDDQVVQHSLTVPVSWYGITHADMAIADNGPIMFGQNVQDPGFGHSAVGVADGFMLQLPGAAAFWGDFNHSNKQFIVFEDSNAGTVSVAFPEITEWATNNVLGACSVTFGGLGANSAFFDYSGWTSGSIHTDFSMGVSDGNPGVGSSTDLGNGLGTGISLAIGSYQSSTSGATLPDSIGETFGFDVGNPATAFPAGINWLDAGIGDWLIF